jgi:hypothetical protein
MRNGRGEKGKRGKGEKLSGMETRRRGDTKKVKDLSPLLLLSSSPFPDSDIFQLEEL